MSSDSVRDYEARLREGTVSRPKGVLPPHHPTCFGCGPEAPWGLHVEARLVDGEIHATHTFVAEHSGAPGIAHGGAVAALIDDVSGFVLFVVGEPAVTRHLEVAYLKPVLVGVRYRLVAKIVQREGRKIFVSCEGRSPDGAVIFSGRALFLIVGLAHFDEATRTLQDGPPFAG